MIFLELPLRNNTTYLVNVKEIKAVYVPSDSNNRIEVTYAGGGSNIVYMTLEEFKQRLQQLHIDVL